MLRGLGDFLQIQRVCCGLGVFARAAPVCCNALGHRLDLRWQGPAAGYLQTCRQCFSVELGSDHLSLTFVWARDMGSERVQPGCWARLSGCRQAEQGCWGRQSFMNNALKQFKMARREGIL